MFFVSQLLLNLLMPRGFPVIQNLQNLIRVSFKLLSEGSYFIVLLSGLQQPDCNQPELFYKLRNHTQVRKYKCLRKCLMFFYNNLVIIKILKNLSCGFNVPYFFSVWLGIKVSTLDKSLYTG